MQDTSKKNFHVALMCAIPEEIGETLKNLENLSEINYGDLKIFSGEWRKNKDISLKIYVSVAWSGWGKVSAARTATRILGSKYKDIPIDMLLFTGVAGSAKSILKQWDIVIPDQLIQHDMDARPIFDKYIIPALKKAKISVPNEWIVWAENSLKEAFMNKELTHFGNVKIGLIGTGDKFISDTSVLESLVKDLPNLYAVEMEGAAVAQVCTQESVPFLILRVISDNADGSAAQNFTDFIEDYKGFSWDLIKSLITRLDISPILLKNK